MSAEKLNSNSDPIRNEINQGYLEFQNIIHNPKRLATLLFYRRLGRLAGGRLSNNAALALSMLRATTHRQK